MDNHFSGCVAVVTGGGAGIGEATCLEFASAGADVVVVDWYGDDAEETVSAIEEATETRAIAVEADISDEDAVSRMAGQIEAQFDSVDILVNNAGIRVEPRPVTMADEASWDEILEVNLKGTAFCSKHLIPLMAEGSIINVASVGATVGRANWSQYDATKGAIVSLTQDMACDHGPEIRVNAISPGWTITEYHLPDDDKAANRFRAEKTSRGGADVGILTRAATPSEIADPILFLASERASFITGVNIPVDGGTSVVGGL